MKPAVKGLITAPATARGCTGHTVIDWVDAAIEVVYKFDMDTPELDAVKDELVKAPVWYARLEKAGGVPPGRVRFHLRAR